MKDRRWTGRIARAAGAAAAAGLIAGLAIGPAGCVGYASYPPVPGDLAINDPNRPPMDEIMIEGLRWAVREYPPDPAEPGAPFAVNLPEGMKPNVYEWIVAQVGQGAVPLTHETAHLPTYHVKSIRVRGDDAQIDLLRPVTELSPTPEGQTVYQMVTARMEGGLRAWHVIGRREWTIGAAEPPAPNYLDDVRAAVEAAKAERAARRAGWKTAPREQPAPDTATATADEPADSGGD